MQKCPFVFMKSFSIGKNFLRRQRRLCTLKIEYHMQVEQDTGRHDCLRREKCAVKTIVSKARAGTRRRKRNTELSFL